MEFQAPFLGLKKFNFTSLTDGQCPQKPEHYETAKSSANRFDRTFPNNDTWLLSWDTHTFPNAPFAMNPKRVCQAKRCPWNLNSPLRRKKRNKKLVCYSLLNVLEIRIKLSPPPRQIFKKLTFRTWLLENGRWHPYINWNRIGSIFSRRSNGNACLGVTMETRWGSRMPSSGQQWKYWLGIVYKWIVVLSFRTRFKSIIIVSGKKITIVILIVS